MKDRMKTQSKEFNAMRELSSAWEDLSCTAIIDDDYPRSRHEYESALSNFIQAMKDNDRFVKGNFYGLVEV